LNTRSSGNDPSPDSQNSATVKEANKRHNGINELEQKARRVRKSKKRKMIGFVRVEETGEEDFRVKKSRKA